ncbi:MAG: hypothetical protein P8130_09055 [Deltaproteobacteria bacterium]
MKTSFTGILAVCFFVGFEIACLMPRVSSAAEYQPAANTPAEAKGGMSDEELNRQLINPVSNVWSLVFQNNYTQLKNDFGDVPGWDEGDDKWYYNLNFQPVLPLHLTRDWNLINRPVFPIFADRPVLESDGFDEVDGLGDIGLGSLFSPAKTAGGFLWGVGPTFIFPTATKDELGQEKWQAGPAAVGIYLGKEWIFGAFPQHWWSYAGNDDRKSTSQTNIQYFIWRIFPGQWQVGTGPNILIDWKADDDNKLTLPMGLGVGKLFKFGGLPIKFILEGQYAAIHPDDFGQEWNIRFTVVPVLPSLLKNPIFDW